MGGGVGFSSKLLNNTLTYIVQLLNENNFDKWFISYGTLLGIVRDNSCINNDDDNDIIIDIKHRDKLVLLLKKHNFSINKYGELTENTPNIIKAQQVNKPSVDFYLVDINKKGDYNDTWNDVIWSECNPLQKKYGIILFCIYLKIMKKS